MTTTVSGSQITFNDNSTQNTSAYGGGFAFRNRIINGAMVIDQRNTGSSTTPTSNGTYTLDRWICGLSQSSKFSVQQSSTAPTGFSNSLLVTSLSSYTVGASEQFAVSQRIEGFNVADFNLGTANAVTFTISFWVRSSLTGTFGGALRNSAQDRSYPFSYTISAANTWEQKTITVTGDTSGTWIGATNGVGLNISFGLGVGSTLSGTAGSWSGNNYVSSTSATSVVGTNGATFYITGVQLEKGSTATSFDYRPYGTELQLCQRYCPMFGPVVADSFSATGYTILTTLGRVVFQFPVAARTAPTGITVTNVSGFYLVPPFARQASAVTFSESNTQYASVDITTTGLTANQPTALRIGTGGSKIEFTGCEL